MKLKKLSIVIPVVFAAMAGKMYIKVKELYNISVAKGDKTKLTMLVDLDEEELILKKNEVREKKEMDAWLLKTPQKYYHIKSFDGLALYANVFIQRKFTDKTVIVVHGYGGCGYGMNYAAKEFYERGFNVVVPDCRGHGKSQGEYIGMGWHDRLDLIEWCDKIIKGNPNSKIILYGVSMGGATVMMLSGEKLPKNIKCIIEDCGYTSAYDEFKYQVKFMYKKLPPSLIVNFVGFMCKLKAGYFFQQASALKQLKKCKVPILFLHGAKDKFVPVKMVYDLYNKPNIKKDLFIINDAGHGVAAMVAKKAYWKRVFTFIDECIIQ